MESRELSVFAAHYPALPSFLLPVSSSLSFFLKLLLLKLLVKTNKNPLLFSFGFKVKKKCEVAQSCPTLCDPMDSSLHQAPLSMGFSREEYWSGLPFPSPENLPNPEIEPRSLTL